MESFPPTSLDHVYWIGGSPCSGKSSVTAALAAQFGMATYSCDDAYYRHLDLVDAVRQPTLHRLGRASCDEIWMRPVEQQVREEIEIYDEEFGFIVDDISQMPHDRPVIAEGAALMPHLLAGIGIELRRSVWIVPSPGFQLEQYARRDWRHDVLADCSDPQTAWENWMQRDIGFARFVSEDARALDRTCVTVDGSRSLDAILAQVRCHFELAA